jgi:hypothetical protein
VCFCIKDNSIAGGPNDPASCNDNLSEDRIIEVYSCLADHIQRFKRSVPKILREFQQAILKGHVKKRWKHVSSEFVLQRT